MTRMTCGALRLHIVTGTLRERNVLTLKVCGYEFSGIQGAVTRVEQKHSFGGIRNPFGWWGKRLESGPDKAAKDPGQIGSRSDVAEASMAQYFPGLFH